MEALFNQIKELGITYHADKIVLFGSRARGDCRERSDIDIAVYGMQRENQVPFANAIDDLQTLLDFDIVFVTDNTAPELLKNIERDGIILMSKMEEKSTKLKAAVQRLKEALSEYASNPSDVVRDGVIQRFEFCTELAWKATREYLIDQGYTDINSPKSALKTAYADGIVNDETAWLSLLNDRNLTSHIYDDATAAEIFGRIQTTHTALFDELVSRLTD